MRVFVATKNGKVKGVYETLDLAVQDACVDLDCSDEEFADLNDSMPYNEQWHIGQWQVRATAVPIGLRG